jgi:hypothetical protein
MREEKRGEDERRERKMREEREKRRETEEDERREGKMRKEGGRVDERHSLLLPSLAAVFSFPTFSSE